MKKFAIMFVLSTVSLQLLAIDYTWTGHDSGGNWSDAGNWTSSSGPGVPNSASDTATFPASLTGLALTAVNVDATFNIGTLTFSNALPYSLSGVGSLIFSSTNPTITTLGGGSNAITIDVLLDNSTSEFSLNIATGTQLLSQGGISGEGLSVNGPPSSGTGTFVLSGPNTYQIGALVSAGTLQIGSTGALSSAGILDLSGAGIVNLETFQVSTSALFSEGGTLNTGTSGILNVTGESECAGLTITGAGSVNLSALLHVSGASSYGSSITGSGGIQLANSTLFLGALNTYSGPTTIASGATLTAEVSNTFSPNSAITANGTLNLGAFSNTILSLSGSGSVTSSNGTLTITNGGTFSGSLQNQLALTLSGGTLNLSGSNNYSGATTISSGATLVAGASSALSPNSVMTVNGTLNLGIFSYTIPSLSGSGIVTSSDGILTITGGGAFSGSLQNQLGLVLNGGTFTLSGTSSNAGTTTVETGATFVAGASNALSPDSPLVINSGATLNLGSFSNSVAQYTQQSGANLDLTVTSTNFGQLTSSGNILLGGNLNVTKSGSFTPSTYYEILRISPPTQGIAITGTFALPITTNFSPPPEVLYTSTSVNLFFSPSSSTWSSLVSGQWDIASNWNPMAVPTNGNTTQVNFGNLMNSNPITVTLPTSTVTLNTMVFDSPTAYAIEQATSASLITFDAASSPGAFIIVRDGSHTIDAPISLNYDTFANLSGGSTLTFGPNTTMSSTSTQAFIVGQTTAGTALLVNNGSLTPNSFDVFSGSVENNGTIESNSVSILSVTQNPIEVINGGTGSVISSTGASGTMLIAAATTTSVINSATNGVIGPSASATNSALFLSALNSSATMTVLNNGVNALLGPSGAGGDFIMIGSGTLTVTNSGQGTRMGAFGSSGTVMVDGGTAYNNLGALFRAGPGGEFIIDGGTVINDQESTVGTSSENTLLTSGTLSTSGSVLAADYTQGTSGTLQINVNSSPFQIGQVTASGTASLSGNLIVNALSGASFPSDLVVDLLTAPGGVSGTFSNVTFQNFNSVIPVIEYIQSAVLLDLSASTVTPGGATTIGSVPKLSFISANQNNFQLQRQAFQLHNRIINRAKKQTTVAMHSRSPQFIAQNEPPAMLLEIELLDSFPEKTLDVFPASEPERNQEVIQPTIVAQNDPIPVEEFHPWNFYMGPIDSFGSIKARGTEHPRIGYNSIGALTGLDYAFTQFGLGFSAAYAYTHATSNPAAHFNENELHLSAYGLWVPKNINELSLNAIVGWGYEWVSTYRTAGTSRAPVTAKGSPSGMEVDALLGVDYILSSAQISSFPKGLTVTPLANLQYIFAKLDQYNESGAGIFDLSVQSQSPNSLRSLIGTRLDYLFNCDNVTIKPELDIGWQYEFLDNDENLGFATVNLASPETVSSQIIGLKGSTLWLGADILVTINKVFTVEASYDLQWSSRYVNNAFYLGLGGNF